MLALIAVLAIVAVACGNKSETGGGKATGKIVWGTTDSTTSNDPAKCYEIFCGNMIQEVYSRLLTYPADGSVIQPDAAKSLPEISSDGLTYKFTLKSGLKFSDGST